MAVPEKQNLLGLMQLSAGVVWTHRNCQECVENGICGDFRCSPDLCSEACGGNPAKALPLAEFGKKPTKNNVPLSEL